MRVTGWSVRTCDSGHISLPSPHLQHPAPAPISECCAPQAICRWCVQRTSSCGRAGGDANARSEHLRDIRERHRPQSTCYMELYLTALAAT